MRTNRLVAFAVTAGLMGVTPLAVSAPAHADGQTYAPVITVNLNIEDSPFDPPYMYGGGFYVSGTVTDPAGLYDANSDADAAYLQIYTPSNPVWTTIATDDSPGFLFFDGDFSFSENTQLKVVYSGAPAAYSYQDTFTAGESAIVAAPVTRKVVLKNPKGTLLKGKISPDYGKKKIKVAKKVGKKWKKYKTFKTTSAGKYKFTLPAPRRGKTQWRITVPGDSKFTKWETKGYTYSTRLQAASKVAFTR